ncbi:restriction endonuclease subunit S [Vibrio alginolyticus]
MSKEYNKALIPERRFPDFMTDESWKIMSFGKAFSRITTKNAENNTNVLTISAQHGLVSQTEYFKRSVAAKDLTGYYLLQKGDFAYNKSYSKGYPMGAIKPLKLYEQGVVSTLYICFKTKNGFSSDYFEHYFESGSLNSEVSKIAQEGGRAHGLLNISVKEFFRDVRLMVPTLPEQQKIADCLSSFDERIALEEKKLDELKAHKKGLVQQLFPSNGKTVPQLRFPEFQNDKGWMREELFNILDKIIDYRGKAPPKAEIGVPLITAKNVRSGWLDMSCDEYIAADKYESWMSKGMPKAGDILFTTEAPLGHVAFFPSDGKFALGQRILTLRTKPEKCIPEFLFQSLLGPQMQNEINFNSTGSTAKGIKSSVFSRIGFCYPEIPEQRKIASFLSSIDKLILSEAKKVEKLKEYKKGLMQQLFPSIEGVDL